MALLQLKVRGKGQSVTWRPGQAGSWLEISKVIEHGDLTICLSNGGGGVEVKVFKGKRGKPLCRQVLRRDGTYILGAKKIKKL